MTSPTPTQYGFWAILITFIVLWLISRTDRNRP